MKLFWVMLSFDARLRPSLHMIYPSMAHQTPNDGITSMCTCQDVVKFEYWAEYIAAPMVLQHWLGHQIYRIEPTSEQDIKREKFLQPCQFFESSLGRALLHFESSIMHYPQISQSMCKEYRKTGGNQTHEA